VAAAAVAITMGSPISLLVDFADEHFDLGLNHEVRLVGLAGAVVDTKLVPSRFEPFFNAGVARRRHREADRLPFPDENQNRADLVRGAVSISIPHDELAADSTRSGRISSLA